MSFGVSISDFHLIIQCTKDVIHNCRYAPSDFAEAARASQSLRQLLEGLESEFKNPDSPLRKDENIARDFKSHLDNCKASLAPLADLTARYTSLGTTNRRFIDRLRFSKKEYLEHRGNLIHYTTQLSEFLQTVGLGSLGRIERKLDGISDSWPELMMKIDQMFAEIRLQDDNEEEGSVFSDHTDDDKLVWRIFRRRLNDAGFTSQVLRDHEAAIFLRIRELNGFGLFETSAAPSICSDEEMLPPYASVDAIFGNDAPIALETPGLEADNAPDEGNSNFTTEERRSPTSPTGDRPARVWRNPAGQAIEKGMFLRTYNRGEEAFIVIVDRDGQEVSVLQNNLSKIDRAYLEDVTGAAIKPPMKLQNVKQEPEKRAPEPEKKADSISKTNKETVELPKRTHPGFLTGARTKPEIFWRYRHTAEEIPFSNVVYSRSMLTNDALPSAAAKGDLNKVKKLLASGEHIESRGPVSWTETVTSTDGEGNTTTHDVRHSYPETTALYRAAEAGYTDVAHLLLRRGADVNTQNGYNGRIGEPILFEVISNSNEKQARMLLEYGARVTRCGSRSPLHVAASQPKLRLVRLVLDYGAKIDTRDSDSQTPLYLATCKFFPKIVQLLLEEGADPDVLTAQGRTALYKAAGNTRADITKLLLQYRADPALGRGRRGETLMYKAAWFNGLETIDLLLDYQADPNLANDNKMENYNGRGEKILHGILGGISKQHSLMNSWGRTALHAAAFRGHTDLVEMLLEGGADTEAMGTDGQTALYLAAAQKHDRTMRVLLDFGAQLETEKYDPVLTLIQARKEEKRLKKLGMDGQIEKKRYDVELAQMGSGDPFVGFVARVAKAWASTR